MNIRPLHDRIVVKRLEDPAEQVQNGIIIPDSAKEKPQEAEVVAVGLSVLIAAQITNDGESNWMEGVLLLAVYAILGAVFYYLPEVTHP